MSAELAYKLKLNRERMDSNAVVTYDGITFGRWWDRYAAAARDCELPARPSSRSPMRTAGPWKAPSRRSWAAAMVESETPSLLV